jgi:hypothetical protein
MRLWSLGALCLTGVLSLALRPGIDEKRLHITWDELNASLASTVHEAGLEFTREPIVVGMTITIPTLRISVPGCATQARLIPVIHEKLDVVQWVHVSRTLAEPQATRRTFFADTVQDGFKRHVAQWRRIAFITQSTLGDKNLRGLNAVVILEVPPGCALPETLNLRTIWRRDANLAGISPDNGPT